MFCKFNNAEIEKRLALRGWIFFLLACQPIKMLSVKKYVYIYFWRFCWIFCSYSIIMFIIISIKFLNSGLAYFCQSNFIHLHFRYIWVDHIERLSIGVDSTISNILTLCVILSRTSRWYWFKTCFISYPKYSKLPFDNRILQ